jgi:CBS domain-containing protein
MSVKLVRDVMRRGVTSCPAHTPLTEAASIMLREGAEALIVLGGGNQAAGVLSKRDIVKAYAEAGTGVCDLQNLTVSDKMSSDVPQIPPDIPALAATQIMLDQGLRDIYIMHHQNSASPHRPVGVFSLNDIIREVAEGCEDKKLINND